MLSSLSACVLDTMSLNSGESGRTLWKCGSLLLEVLMADGHVFDSALHRHASEVGDECKPLIFKDGVRVTFPTSTKSVRPPRASRLHSRFAEGAVLQIIHADSYSCIGQPSHK